MNPGAALWGGIAGAIAMIPIIWGFYGVRATRLDLLRFAGGIVTAQRGPVLYVYGMMAQLALGALMGVAYGFALDALGGATNVGWGALLGLAHGALVAAALPLLARGNREVRAGALPRPGTFGRAYGQLTPVGLLAAFGVFGLWVGLIVLPVS